MNSILRSKRSLRFILTTDQSLTQTVIICCYINLKFKLILSQSLNGTREGMGARQEAVARKHPEVEVATLQYCRFCVFFLKELFYMTSVIYIGVQEYWR